MNIKTAELDDETVLALLRADLLTNALGRRAHALTEEERGQFIRLDRALWKEYDRRKLRDPRMPVPKPDDNGTEKTTHETAALATPGGQEEDL